MPFNRVGKFLLSFFFSIFLHRKRKKTIRDDERSRTDQKALFLLLEMKLRRRLRGSLEREQGRDTGVRRGTVRLVMASSMPSWCLLLILLCKRTNAAVSPRSRNLYSWTLNGWMINEGIQAYEKPKRIPKWLCIFQRWCVVVEAYLNNWRAIRSHC